VIPAPAGDGRPDGPVRTIFFGSGSFAVPILDALVGDPATQIVAVVASPDRPSGRGGALTPAPVAARAMAHGLPLLRPVRLRDAAAVDALGSLVPALGVLADYGRLVPPTVLTIPAKGFLNVHPSLLPRHRGASPIPATILADDPRAGVTLMAMDAGLDTGPIVAASVEISPAVNGTCSSPVGPRTPFPGGTRGPGATGGPTRSPSAGGNGLGGNGFGGRAFGGFGAFGKVTAVNGATFTVESSRPQGGGTATTAAPGAAVPTTETVETSAVTTYTRTKSANAKVLAVGLCVTALGKASDTGSIAATSIILRPAENGSCSTGFGRRGPGGSPTSTGGGSGA
jgi:folate-dependent phosphoribosylglycinamide formyltransferase PurN